MYTGLHVKHSLFLSVCYETCPFSTNLSKNNQTPNFIKIRPVGTELFHADRRTDGQTWQS